MKFSKLISELKRRNVFKATIAYLAIAWVIIQIASIVLPIFDVPDYALKALLYVLSVGLIVWIGFSWIYDLTPEGFQKTDDSSDNEEILKLTNRRLNKIIVGSLSIAVVLLIIISFWAGSRWDDGSNFPDNIKVAVIPLVQQLEGEEEEFFKIGMTEELISELSKVDQLTVISQASTQVLTTSFNPTKFSHIESDPRDNLYQL